MFDNFEESSWKWIHREHVVNVIGTHVLHRLNVGKTWRKDAFLWHTVYKDIRNLLIKDVIHLVMTTRQNSEYQTSRVLWRFHPKQSSFFCKFGCRSSTKQTTWTFFFFLIVRRKNLRVFMSLNSAAFHWTLHFQILY